MRFCDRHDLVRRRAAGFERIVALRRCVFRRQLDRGRTRYPVDDHRRSQRDLRDRRMAAAVSLALSLCILFPFSDHRGTTAKALDGGGADVSPWPGDPPSAKSPDAAAFAMLTVGLASAAVLAADGSVRRSRLSPRIARAAFGTALLPHGCAIASLGVGTVVGRYRAGTRTNSRRRGIAWRGRCRMVVAHLRADLESRRACTQRRVGDGLRLHWRPASR